MLLSFVYILSVIPDQRKGCSWTLFTSSKIEDFPEARDEHGTRSKIFSDPKIQNQFLVSTEKQVQRRFEKRIKTASQV